MESMKATEINRLRQAKKKTCQYVLLTFLIVVGMAPCLPAQATRQQNQPALFSQTIKHNRYHANVLNKIISVDLHHASIEQGLRAIAKETGLKLVFSKNIIPSPKSVSLHNKNITLEDALWRLLAGTDLRFGVSSHNHLVVMKSPKGDKQTEKQMQQLEAVSGTVTDASTGEVLPGVNIKVKGTTTGTFTDDEGHYELDVASLQDTLVFSFVGYQTQQVQISGRTEISVEMQSQAISGQEMVVVGYGQQERENITGSISSVSSEDINTVPTAGLQESLQGLTAGVDVTPTTGQPGAPVDMDVRGVSTFGDSNPLFVIDGMPVFVGSGGHENPLASIDPHNIESVQILKDASAAAIYGARAANGVVIITTKKGQAGDTQVSLSASGGVNKVTKTIGMMDSEQYINFATEAYNNAGAKLPTAFTEPELSQNLSRNTEWEKEANSPAITQDYHVNVSGGNKNATYSFSTGYFNQEGTLPNSRFQRYSAKINSNIDVTDKLQVTERIQLSRSNWNGEFGLTNDFYQELLQSSPTMPVRCPENLGGFCGPENKYSPIFRANRLGILNVQDQTTQHNILRGNISAIYDFTDSFSYRLHVGGDFAFNNSREFIPKYDMGGRSNARASLDENRTNRDNWLIENILKYQNVFNEVHDVTLLLGFSEQQNQTRFLNGNREEFPNNQLRVLNAGFGSYDLGGNKTEWALRSEIARLDYTFNNKYNLMAALRRDGSSRFGKNTRYGIFPSFSGNWRIKNESFMRGIEGLSSLTLRGSWGIVGNQDIANYASIASIEPGQRYILGLNQSLVPGASYIQQGNPNLKWETTKQTNIGLDIGLFDDRLSFVMDYYIKNTDGILLRVPIPSTTGFNRDQGAYRNAGSVSNRGFEFSVNYQNTIGKVNYTVSGNISTNNNKVESLGGGKPIFFEERSDPNYIRTITKAGNPVSQFYGWVAEGVFKDQGEVNNHATQETGTAPGDIKFKDLNGDGIINDNDQKIIGNPFPDFNYGLNLNLGYRNFNLVLQLQGKQGQDIYNLIWAGINDGEGDNNVTTEMLDRWTSSNRNTKIPRAIFGDPNRNTRPSTRFVENGSYLRIRNIKLGYSINPQITNRLGISQLRIYLQARNVATFSNYRGDNPEIGRVSGTTFSTGVDYGAYPIPRSIQAGFRLDI